MLLNCGVGEDSWESLGQLGDPVLHPKENQSWIFFGRTNAEAENSNTLATWCEELTHWKRPWCWERLKVGGEGDDRGWDGWMASLTRWTWVWVSSGSWWWTGRPGVLQPMGSQRVQRNWATGLNWIQRRSLQQYVFFPKNYSIVWLFSEEAGQTLSNLPMRFLLTPSYMVQELSKKGPFPWS